MWQSLKETKTGRNEGMCQHVNRRKWVRNMATTYTRRNGVRNVATCKLNEIGKECGNEYMKRKG